MRIMQLIFKKFFHCFNNLFWFIQLHPMARTFDYHSFCMLDFSLQVKEKPDTLSVLLRRIQCPVYDVKNFVKTELKYSILARDTITRLSKKEN